MDTRGNKPPGTQAAPALCGDGTSPVCSSAWKLAFHPAQRIRGPEDSRSFSQLAVTLRPGSSG